MKRFFRGLIFSVLVPLIFASLFACARTRGIYIGSEGGQRLSQQEINGEKFLAPEKEPIKAEEREEEATLTPKFLRASFKTAYADSTKERKNNIALAAAAIDGTVVAAGETFSFNAVVGERTENRGYQQAKTILYGEYVLATGGGVCQVSSTLYNAWLKANLAVEKSAPHSIPSSYLEKGLDAMVSETSDLVLRNDTPYAVEIKAEADGKNITFSVYGEKLDFEIRLKSEVLSTLVCEEYEPPTEEEPYPSCPMKVVQKPRDGYVVQTYRVFLTDGKIVNIENVRRSTYLAKKGKKGWDYNADEVD